MPGSPPPRPARRAWWRDALLQALVIALLAGAAAWLVHQTLANMRERGIASGFDFLAQPAGFAIGESPIAFDSAESVARAFAVGLLNTLRVAAAGIVLATVLGTLIGIARVSSNLLARTLAGVYVHALRNVPLLLQLFIWYFLLTELLPPVEEALAPLPGLFLSKSGLQFPWPVHNAAGWAIEWPHRTALNIDGGAAVTPEFLTVLLGLTLYTAAYVAEVVRAGLQAVPWGQRDAAMALGMTRTQALRHVLLPQALRVIVPPLTSQLLNLTKNSSLAVAVGYPELVSIANTALNQTGRAIECIAIVMACYLVLSLATSLAMNVYNRRVALRGR